MGGDFINDECTVSVVGSQLLITFILQSASLPLRVEETQIKLVQLCIEPL